MTQVLTRAFGAPGVSLPESEACVFVTTCIGKHAANLNFARTTVRIVVHIEGLGTNDGKAPVLVMGHFETQGLRLSGNLLKRDRSGEVRKGEVLRTPVSQLLYRF